MDYNDLYESWLNGNKSYVVKQLQKEENGVYSFVTWLQEECYDEIDNKFNCLANIMKLLDF